MRRCQPYVMHVKRFPRVDIYCHIREYCWEFVAYLKSSILNQKSTKLGLILCTLMYHCVHLRGLHERTQPQAHFWKLFCSPLKTNCGLRTHARTKTVCKNVVNFTAWSTIKCKIRWIYCSLHNNCFHF